MPAKKKSIGKKVKKREGRSATKAKTPAPKPVSEKPNLIVTYDPQHEGAAKQEVEYLFRKIRLPVSFSDSGVAGLFKLKTADARKAVKRLNELSGRSPETFSSTYHYVPVDEWTSSDVGEMKRAVGRLEHEISSSDKWKLDVHKRHWDKLSETDLVMELTDVIDRPRVDLKNPDKIIQVEIVGREAGISVLKRGERLYVPAR